VTLHLGRACKWTLETDSVVITSYVMYCYIIMALHNNEIKTQHTELKSVQLFHYVNTISSHNIISYPETQYHTNTLQYLGQRRMAVAILIRNNEIQE